MGSNYCARNSFYIKQSHLQCFASKPEPRIVFSCVLHKDWFNSIGQRQDSAWLVQQQDIFEVLPPLNQSLHD